MSRQEKCQMINEPASGPRQRYGETFVARHWQLQGRFDLDFSMICHREGKEGSFVYEVNLTPSPADTRARYDNRILVSRFVTSLPEGNIIQENLEVSRERRGEMIFVLPNFLQNQIVAYAIKISAKGDLTVLRTGKLEISGTVWINMCK